MICVRPVHRLKLRIPLQKGGRSGESSPPLAAPRSTINTIVAHVHLFRCRTHAYPHCNYNDYLRHIVSHNMDYQMIFLYDLKKKMVLNLILTIPLLIYYYLRNFIYFRNCISFNLLAAFLEIVFGKG